MINNNIKYIFIVLYIIITIIITSYLANKPIISFFNNNFKNYHLVVARYNEDIDWINNDPFNQFNIVLYNKGDDLSDKYNSKCQLNKLDNVGRESHTYLYHIIKNYDNLAPITVFIPGSTVERSFKYDVFIKNIEILNNTNDSVFYGCHMNNVIQDMYDFIIIKEDPIYGNGLEEAQIKPFGKFIESTMGTDISCSVICYQGIFIVSKKHITQHPKQKYINLIKHLENSSNPEVGHYMERAWGILFAPYPKSCVSYRESGLAPGC